jgi:uracil-DNA glycosylase
MPATVASSALALLRAHLDQRASHGTKLVALSKDARLALRSLIQYPPNRRGSEPAQPLAAPEAAAVPVANDGASAAAVFAQALAPVRSAPATSQVAAELAPPPPLESLIIEVPGDTVEAKIVALAGMAEADPRPRELRTLRPTMVFATGSPRSSIMFVGEAPGSEEEQQREPFVGPAGQLLTKIISAMGLKRPDVYISNICKFRPSSGQAQGTSNRPPSIEELRACLPYIITEIALIKPQVIVALGASAATGLGIEGPVGKNRGRFHSACGAQVMVTYHPSYLIREEQRDGGLKAKRLVWEDMLAVMEKLALPISDKQRGYFRSAT